MARAIPVEVLLAGVRDTSGEPLAGGKVYAYSAGTTAAKTLFRTADQTSAATNPVVLDSAGRALVYALGSYKLVIKDSADATVYTWDNLTFQLSDPDFETERTYTPTVTPSGGTSPTYTITGTTDASYYVEGALVEIFLQITGTITGGPNQLLVSLPSDAPCRNKNHFVVAYFFNGTTTLSAIGNITSNGVSVFMPSGAAFTNAAGTQIDVSGRYRRA